MPASELHRCNKASIVNRDVKYSSTMPHLACLDSTGKTSDQLKHHHATHCMFRSYRQDKCSTACSALSACRDKPAVPCVTTVVVSSS